MQFEEIGNPEGQALVLMGWPFTTQESLRPLAERLDGCRVILPSWGGQTGGDNHFSTRQHQATQILAYLKRQGIARVSIAGISLGASVGIELAQQILWDGTIELGNVLCDGGTFLRRNWVTRQIRSLLLAHLFRQVRKGTEEEAMSLLLQSKLLKLILGNEMENMRPMLEDMIHVARMISSKSIRAEQKACCTFNWPELPDAVTRRIIFLWAGRDPSRHAARKLRKNYPNAVYQVIGKLGHGGLALQHPQDYTLLLKGLTQNPSKD